MPSCWVLAPLVCCSSNYSIAGKHFPGPGATGASAELRIYGSVLNIFVAQPVFGKVDVLAGVKDAGAAGIATFVHCHLFRLLAARTPKNPR